MRYSKSMIEAVRQVAMYEQFDYVLLDKDNKIPHRFKDSNNIVLDPKTAQECWYFEMNQDTKGTGHLLPGEAYYPYYYNSGDGLSTDGLNENGEEFKNAYLVHDNIQINYKST